MERNKSAIPTGSLVLLTKPNANGECKVFLRYYLGKYVKKCTDIRVPVEDWDDVHQCVKKTNRNSVRLNNELATIKSAVDERLLAYKGRITLEVLQAALGKGEDAHEEEKILKPSQQDFVEYAKMVNDMYYAKKDFGYTTWYNKNKYIEAFEWFVTKFDRSERVRLDTLNVEVFNRYIAYRFNDKKNTSKEGVNKTLVPLYEAIKYAVSVGLVSQKDVATILDNYVNMRNTEYNPEDDSEEVIRYLTENEIKMIEEIQPKMKNQRTREIIDFFLFSYYACGLRLSDILTLEWSNIDFENKRIDKVQVKTKKKFEIALPLSKPAMEILLRWKGYNRNKRFVFDLLPEKYDLLDQKKLFMQRNAKEMQGPFDRCRSRIFPSSIMSITSPLRSVLLCIYAFRCFFSDFFAAERFSSWSLWSISANGLSSDLISCKATAGFCQYLTALKKAHSEFSLSLHRFIVGHCPALGPR